MRRTAVVAAVSGVFAVLGLATLSQGPQPILVHRLGPSAVELWRAGGAEAPRRFLEAGTFDYNGSYSAHGQWVVFTSDRAGSADLYRVHRDGSGLERLTDDPAFDDQGALSPDGTELAFVSTRGSGSTDVHILTLATRTVRNLTNAPGGDFRPSWSPDGQWLAFSSDRGTGLSRDPGAWEQTQEAGIYLIKRDGTGLRRLTPAGRYAGSPKWSRDGSRVVFYDMALDEVFRFHERGQLLRSTVTSQIVSIDVASGAREEHTSGPGIKTSPQYLDDRIAYLVKAGPRPGLAYTNGEVGPRGVMRNPSWTSDGKETVADRTYYPPDRPRRHRSPLFSRDPGFALFEGGNFPSVSREGSLVLAVNNANGDFTLARIAAGTDSSAPLFASAGKSALAPQWSPDGTWIAFGLGSFFTRREEPARLMLVRPDGSDPREVPTGAGNSGFPSWSPDGTRLVYRSWGPGDRGLRIVTLATGAVVQLTTGYDNFPAWSPSRDLIAFTRQENNDFDIYTIRPDGTGLKRLTTSSGNDAHAVWSSDGRFLLFSSTRLGFRDELPLSEGSPQPAGEIFLMRFDGGGQRPLTDNQFEDGTPAWVPAKQQ